MKWHRAVPGTLAALVLGLGFWPPASVPGATVTQRKQAAGRMVAEALRHEISGADASRNRLLRSALEQVSNYAPALWHSGFVQRRNEWLRYDELPAVATGQSRLAAYRRQRAKAANTTEGQMELADWCSRKKLRCQERAHLTRVLEISPDHPQARQRLGYRRVDGVWLSGAEISRAAVHAKEMIEAVSRWRPELEKILESLGQRSGHQRDAAAARLLAIDDPAAIPAMELLFSRHGEESALLLVRALDKMTAHQASAALARQALFSPWESVRRAAVEKLATRDVQTYVPMLLAAMGTPVQSRAQLYTAPGGRLMFRHTFVRQGQHHEEMTVFETEYRRTLLSATDPADVQMRRGALGQMRRQDAAVKARTREMAVARQNLFIQKFNEHICDVLSTATGESLASSPEAWWQWWNDYNEVFYAGAKPARVAYRRETVAFEDPYADVPATSPQQESSSSASRLRARSRSMSECLVAGTPVWTESGPTAIEEIQVGDLVLSQDPQTGRLAYKPVLRTTIRVAEHLVKIEAGRESIQCSGGHPFWVSGKGWVKARQLKSGRSLHCVTGTLRVGSVVLSGFEKTHNLIVADFHTYFVGKAKVLSHDNTIRSPTNALVPGLVSR